MIRMPMSRAASGLLRALLARVPGASDRILLSQASSQDWRSLTLEGERHTFCFRIGGDDPARLLTKLTDGLEDAEFNVPGQIVADIVVTAVSGPDVDGALGLTIEALTVAE
ncbi:MAG TPA: hypothetical protein VM265_01795 [Sphingomicrobium sp.]|nr:hypothetical protein [Sphingomicrobium sp.]